MHNYKTIFFDDIKKYDFVINLKKGEIERVIFI